MSDSFRQIQSSLPVSVGTPLDAFSGFFSLSLSLYGGPEQKESRKAEKGKTEASFDVSNCQGVAQKKRVS